MVADGPLDPVDSNSALQFRIEHTSCHSRCFDVSWQVPADLPYLQGHFPDFPVLPAVATLEASCEMLRRALGQARLDLHAISSAKFMQPIQPGQRVRVHLQAMAGEDQWLAEWCAADASDGALLASVAFCARL